MQKSQLIPLLLPNPSGSLLIIGWKDFLVDTDFTGWDSIIVFSKKAKKNKKKFTFIHNKVKLGYQAILVLSTREYIFFQSLNQTQNTPFAYFGRYCDTFNKVIKNQDYYLIYGHPFTNPLYWFSYRSNIKYKNRLIYEKNIISPRGRFDLFFLSLDNMLQKLLPPKFSTHFIICGLSYSVLGKYIYESNNSGCLIQSTKTGKIILFNSNSVIKIIHTNNNNHPAYNALVKSANNIPNSKNIANLIPDSRTEWQDNCEITREKNFRGVAAYKYLGKTKSLLKIFNNTSDALLQWYGKTTSVVVNNQWLESNIASYQPAIKTQLNFTHQNKLDNISEILYERLSDIEIPKVPEHGDLWLNNIIVDPDSFAINGIIDWDFSKSEGLPFIDLFHLLSWRTSRFQADFSANKLFIPHEKYRELILKHASKIDFPDYLLNEFYAIYWLKNTNKMLQCGIEKTIDFKLLFPKSLDSLLGILSKK